MPRPLDEEGALRLPGEALINRTRHSRDQTADARQRWAKLIADPTLSAGDDDTAKRRADIIHPAIWDLATGRWYGCLFLRHAAVLLPAAVDALKTVADCFVAKHGMMWEVGREAGGEHPGAALPKLADPKVRETIARIILLSRGQDLAAAKHIRRALEQTGG